MFERKILRGLMLAMMLALLVAALLPVVALADKGGPGGGVDPSFVNYVSIEGDPLTIHVAEDTSIQVLYAGQPLGQTYPADFDEGDSGALAWIGAAAPVVYGPDWVNHDSWAANLVTPWTLSGQTSGGSGTSGDPWEVTTASVAGATQLDVIQWVRYVDGESCFRVMYTVNHSLTDEPQSFTFFHAADFYVDGDDSAYGSSAPGTGAVGAWDEDMDFAMYFLPVLEDLGFDMPPASHYQEGEYWEIWEAIGSTAGAGPGFNDTVRLEWHDSGAGLQWDLALPGVDPPGNFIEFGLDWCFEGWDEEEFVPEPGSVLLLGSGLMGLAGYATLRLRRR